MPRRPDRQTEFLSEPQTRRRRPSGWLECLLGLAVGLAGLVASRLGQLWIAFDVFSQFTLQFAVIAAAFLVGLLMPRAKLLTAAVLLVLGIAGIGMWPHLASRDPWPAVTAAEGERALKVASFNTLWINNDADAERAKERHGGNACAYIDCPQLAKETKRACARRVNKNADAPKRNRYEARSTKEDGCERSRPRGVAQRHCPHALR